MTRDGVSGEPATAAHLETLPDMVSRHRRDGTVVWVSSGALPLLGFSPEELVGQNLAVVLQDGDPARVITDADELVASGASTVGSRWARRRDGSTLLVEMRAVAVPAADGQAEILTVLRRPSDEQRRASFALAERHLLERIARGGPLAEVLELACSTFEAHASVEGVGATRMCSILVAQGPRLAVAAAGTVPLALLRKLVDGLPIDESVLVSGAAAARRERVVCPDLALEPRVGRHLEAAQAEGIRAAWSTPILSSTEQILGVLTVYERRTGSPGTEELELCDRLVHLAGLVLERERVTAALRASEEHYRAVVDGLEEVIFHLDGALGLTFVNAAVTRVIGCTVEEALGAPLVGFIHPDDRSHHAPQLRALLELERESYEGELRMISSDGGQRWVRLRARPMIGPEGGVVGLSGSLADVSERKKLEAQLLVSDRMASMGTLVAGVAHEINNPLASMMLNLDYIARELSVLGDKGGPEARGRVDKLADPLRAVSEGAERVRDIVKNLRIFSRGDERRRPVELHHVLDSTLRMASNEVRHRARIVKSYGRVPVVEANEASLGQVFLNLLVNAAHAIPDGNVEGNRIEIRTFSDEKGRAVVEIFDTGAGIAAEHLDRIFDPFFTTKPVGVGTGLGLSICHRLVSGLGGEISVESQVGAGTTFRVALPGTARKPPEERAPLPVVTPARRGTVLVVDDEPVVGAAVKRMLAPLHDVTHVSSGEEALGRLAAGENFDVILCDLMMPRMTGMQLYDELRRTSPDVAQRIVFITGGAFTPRAKSFLETVPNLVLDKPFEFKLLAAAINDLLRSARAAPG
jgi:PAS domain S-box-containing protein